MKSATVVVPMLVACVVLMGCSKQGQDQRNPDAIGASMQKSGIMSQADYARIGQVQRDVSQTHAISDADLDFTLGLLKTANNAIPRARAMTALSEIRPMSTAQKAKIAPAIAPFLQSTDKLDKLGAERVQKSMAS